eukprot:841411_1
MDVSEQNTYFEWNITNYLLKKWKNAQYEQWFQSPPFNAIGQQWVLAIYPNGDTTEGTAHLLIGCKSIESEKETELNVCHYIGIAALNHHQTNFDGNTIKTDKPSIECISPFQLHGIKNESEITICVQIWQKGSIERNEGQLISNIYSDKMKILQRQYAKNIHDLQTEHLER